MKSYLMTTFALAVAAVSNSLTAEIQQKQLTREVMLQFEELSQKGDESKQEYILKNPHFFWMDSSATAPTILGEVDLKGTLKVTADFKGNHIDVESDGITHLIVHSSAPGDEPINVSINGKVFKSIDLDFKKIEGAVAEYKAGRASQQTLLTFLEAIKKSTTDAKNLKITGDRFGTDKDPTLVELAKLTYAHTSGATPEEFTANVKSKRNWIYMSPSALFKLASAGNPGHAYNINYDLNTKLPTWSKLLEFITKDDSEGFPDASFGGKVSAKSQLGESNWDANLTSKKLENGHYLVEGKWNNENSALMDWIKEVQGMTIEPISSNHQPEDKLGRSIVDWLKSPKTAPFLALIPLQSSIDWNGALEYIADAGNFSVEAGKFSFSLLGKRKTGIQMNLNYKKGEASSDLTLLGGRGLFDHGAALYNAFTDSIESYWKLPKISKEDTDQLYQLFARYSNQPGKEASEMKFTVKHDRNGITIGGKDASEFLSDLSNLYRDYADRQARLESQERPFDSYKVQPKAQDVNAQPKWPSEQEAGSRQW